MTEMPFFLVLLVLFAPSIQRPTDIVRWSAMTPEKPVVAGRTVKIELTARIQEGWKLYALTQPKGGPIPLAIEIEKDEPFAVVRKQITAPRPKIQKDDNFNLETQYYEREAAFTVPVTVSKRASANEQVPLDVTFQACGASICLRPFTQRINVDITVAR